MNIKVTGYRLWCRPLRMALGDLLAFWPVDRLARRFGGLMQRAAGPTIKLSDCQIGDESSILAALRACWLTGHLAGHWRAQFKLELKPLMPLVVKIEVFAQMPANRSQKNTKTQF